MLGVSEKQSILDAMEHLLARYLEIRPWSQRRARRCRERGAGKAREGNRMRGKEGSVGGGRSGEGRSGEVEQEGAGKKGRNVCEKLPRAWRDNAAQR